MAQFHCDIKVYTRKAGHSAVAAAAYQARCVLIDDTRGVVQDYRRTHRHEELVADLGVILPAHAPARFGDRATLWNEVERMERGPNAQLARRIEFALPVELSRAEQIALARRIAEAFAEQEGMCVDACVHDAIDGHNPHVHLLMPLRPTDDDGFGPKSVNVYTVRDANGAEEHLTAAELKTRNGAGAVYEKVYRYRRGSETRTLTTTQAGQWDGSKRVNKTPVQETRYLADWNENHAVEWRGRIADMSNEALAAHGSEARVSPLSYAERGICKAPQVHEGAYVHRIETDEAERSRKTGAKCAPITDRGRWNESVRKANDELHKLLELLELAVQALKSLIAAQRVQQDKQVETKVVDSGSSYTDNVRHLPGATPGMSR